ncbi:MAG: T9SS type A sorting domain-containing protein, partial [Flavisolibacter sp.]|nr:T9SS type A sorting domain-containing protein [Flavisolibacter sp.]
GDLDQISDIDGDGIADTIETVNGYHEMILDDLGNIHVWTGYYLLLDDDPAEGWSFFPTANGAWYWTTGMTEMAFIDLLVDWNNDDGADDPFAGIGLGDFGLGNTYRFSTFHLMFNAALEESTGRIYLIYTQPIEYTDLEGNPASETAQSYRDIFGVYSDDGGNSYSEPINLSYSAFNIKENAFPFCYDRVIDGKVHVVWQQDEEAGNTLAETTDPILENDILYAGWGEDRFQPYAPSPDFEFSIASGTVTFTNNSEDAETYSWLFDDGTGASSLTNPVHTYAANGDYNVCLTATNVYGSMTACKTVTITNVSITDAILQNAINIYPTPSNGLVTVEINTNVYASVTIDIYNIRGERLESVNADLISGKTSLDLTDLAKGNYLLKIVADNGGVATKQISIN